MCLKLDMSKMTSYTTPHIHSDKQPALAILEVSVWWVELILLGQMRAKMGVNLCHEIRQKKKKPLGVLWTPTFDKNLRWTQLYQESTALFSNRFLWNLSF